MNHGGQSCESCRFFKPVSDVHPVGDCRRHAPLLLDSGLRSPLKQFNPFFDDAREWPHTRKDDWCGEWSLIIPMIPAAKICPTCGETCRPDDLKCDECGHDL